MEQLPLTLPVADRQAVEEIMACNDETVRFGLQLSRSEAIKLVEARYTALQNTGRLEFGQGVVGKIIRAFCASPYISRHNYLESLHELIEIFYFYKNETQDLLGDDDLIQFMKKSFDGSCQGSLELLKGRELALLARELRSGQTKDWAVHSPAAEKEEKGEDHWEEK